MKPVYRIILFILICWFGYHAFRQTLAAQDTGMFGVFQNTGLIILIILTITAIVTDIKAYQSNQKLWQFYSSMTGLFFCAIVFVQLVKYSNIEKSKTIFRVATRPGSQHVFSIQFKEDDYLRIEELSRLGAGIYYGKYHKSHDSIIITQTNYDKLTASLPVSGVIKKDVFILNGRDTFLVEALQQ